MKKRLLSITLMALMGASLFSQTPYAYYPYYRAGVQTPFAVPTDKVDADLTTTTNRASFVMLGSWFDQTNLGGVPSYAADETKTIIAGEAASSWTPLATNDRIVTETAANTNSADWNYTTDVFSKRGQTLFYTVNFSAAGNYKIYLRHNENKAVPYVVDVFSKADMDVKIKTFTLNAGGMSTTAGSFSTDIKAQYVTAGGGTSLWIKTVDALTIASPGDYVIKIKNSVGFRFNFGGFTILPVPAAAVAEVSLTKPIAPGAAVAVNKVATLKALATPAGANNISKVEFFEGANLLGEGALVGGFYEFNWTPTVAGSYVITAKLTESDNAVTTSSTSNIEVVNSVAYITRTAWTDVVEAEDYDLGGGEYGAFYDITTIAANAVSGYRTDGTDAKHRPAGHCVQLGNGGTGWSVGYTLVGEKLSYTIKDVPTGYITVAVNYATPEATAQLKVSLNGTVLGTMALPSTTDWNVFLPTTSGAIAVTGDADSDDDVLTIEFVGKGSNLDFFSLATAPASYTTTVNFNANGTVGAYTNGEVITSNTGTAVAYTITPDAGYMITSVLYNGVEVKGDMVGNVYTAPALTSNATLVVQFDVSTAVNKTAISYQCFGKNNAIQFNGLTLGDNVSVYNVAGAKVFAQKVSNSDFTISVARGIYMVRIANSVSKVMVK